MASTLEPTAMHCSWRAANKFRRADRNRAQRAGYVYVMRAEGHYHGRDRLKVGVSINPKDRLKDLAASSPIRLELINAYPSEKPYSHESDTHDFLAAYHSHAEWFTLNAQAAAFVVHEVIAGRLDDFLARAIVRAGMGVADLDEHEALTQCLYADDPDRFARLDPERLKETWEDGRL